MTGIVTSTARGLGVAGSLIGLLALAASVLPFWLMPLLDTKPHRPADEVIARLVRGVKERLAAKEKGLEYQAPAQTQEISHKVLPIFSLAAVSLGLVAITLAVIAVIRREERLLAAVAAALGISAIAFQVVLIALGVMIVLAVIWLLGLGAG